MRLRALFIGCMSLSIVHAQVEPAQLGNGAGSSRNSGTPEVEMVLQQATLRAQKAGARSPGVEHLLIALLDDESVLEALANQQVDADAIRASLEYHFSTSVVDHQSGAGQPLPDPAVQGVFRRAFMKNMLSNRREIATPDLLVAILVEENSFAASTLREHGLTVEEAENESLNRYLENVAEQTRRTEELEAQIAEEQKLAPNQARAALGEVVQRSESVGGPKRFTLRVSADGGANGTRFKAAVSRDGRLDLYIESAPFETEFVATRIAALFDAIDAETRLNVELITEIEGQQRTVAGFSGTAGAIFEDQDNRAQRRSGTL